jgi:hypothetical protein
MDKAACTVTFAKGCRDPRLGGDARAVAQRSVDGDDTEPEPSAAAGVGIRQRDGLRIAGRRGRLPLFLHRLGEEEIVECLHPETAASQWQVPYRTTFEDRYGYNNGPRSPSGCSGEKR